MPNTKREFINNEIYHVFNRGVEKRIVFMNDDDHFRFIFALYECNDRNFVRMSRRIANRIERKSQIVQGDTLPSLQTKRELLVEVLAFTLMPNHYHLILRQIVEGGISLFMKKLSNSYTGYFNDKHERKGMGALFQGAFKTVHVWNNNQLLHLAEYVFSNPIELIDPNWKTGGSRGSAELIEYLKNYKWSSYPDSIGIKNFPSVSERDFLWKIFSNSDSVEKGMGSVRSFTEEWIKNKRTLLPELSME